MLVKKHLILAVSLSLMIFITATNTRSSGPGGKEVTQQPVATKYDEFQFVAWNDLKARLDTFAIELQEQRERTGYIIVYASGRCSRPAEAINLAHNTKAYLTVARNVPGNRITTISGGFRETRFFELWLVPTGAANPSTTPTITRRRARVSSRCPALPRNTM